MIRRPSHCWLYGWSLLWSSMARPRRCSAGTSSRKGPRKRSCEAGGETMEVDEMRQAQAQQNQGKHKARPICHNHLLLVKVQCQNIQPVDANIAPNWARLAHPKHAIVQRRRIFLRAPLGRFKSSCPMIRPSLLSPSPPDAFHLATDHPDKYKEHVLPGSSGRQCGGGRVHRSTN